MSSNVEGLTADIHDAPAFAVAAATARVCAVKMSIGDPTVQLFEAAVHQHSARLLRIARAIVGFRASPEDIVQQALMNLYRHRERYDWREPVGLLRRSVVNEALRVLRRPRLSTVADDHPSRDQTPVGDMIDRETVQRVRAAIDRLPEHFRAALVLCEYEGLAYTQIAETLDCSVPQVKTWLHRGRRQLAQMLKDYVASDGTKPS